MKIKIQKKSNEEVDELLQKKVRHPKKPLLEKKDNINFGQKSNIHYLVYFLCAVFVCVVIALTFRVITTIKSSTFDTSSYSLLVSSESPFIISVDTASNNLSIIDVTNSNIDKKAKSLELNVPIDSKIVVKNGQLDSEEYPSFGFLWSVILRPWEYKFENLTPFDVFKLVQFSLGMQEKDMNRAFMEISQDGQLQGLSSDEVYDIFKDPIIINEQQSIEVLNGTDMEGLAGQVSLLIRNTGGNVVSVGSTPNSAKSQLVSSNNSETLKRLSRILNIVPTVDPNFTSISDIKIKLGQDFVKAK